MSALPQSRPCSRLATTHARSIWLALLAVCALTQLNCSGAQVQQRQARLIELDPIEMKADRQSGQPQVYVKDRDALYETAMVAFKAGQWAEALRDFERVLHDFPGDVSRYAVEFNAALCLQKLGRHAEAAQRFADARSHCRGSRHARDAIFLEAEANEAQQKWNEAAQLYRAALEDPAVQADIGGKLGLLDELEAWARLGVSLRKAGDPTRADKAFKQAERLYEDHRDAPLIDESEWVARSMFERGEIYQELFTSIRFKLPVERMKKELEDKSNLFLKAENVYFRCVRLHTKPWSLMAGMRIGDLYGQWISDIENAEIPPGLDAYTMEVYRDELWNHNERLAKRAVTIYKNNMDLAERLGEKSGAWYEKSYQGQKRIEQMIEVNTARRARLLKATPEEVNKAAAANPPTGVPLPATATPTQTPAAGQK